MQLSSFRELKIWVDSMDYTDQIYEITRKFPREEQFGITSQIRRAISSVPSNIAEGFSRTSTKDYIRFLEYALGSLYESETQIEICYRQKYLGKDKFDSIVLNFGKTQRMILKLISVLRKKL